MPRINILYKENHERNRFLSEIIGPVRAAVSEAISVGKYCIPPEKIDWNPIVLQSSAAFQGDVTFEIETAGFPGRKHHFRPGQTHKDDPLVRLRNKIGEIDYFKKPGHESFTVHIIFQDTENRSVTT